MLGLLENFDTKNQINGCNDHILGLLVDFFLIGELQVLNEFVMVN